jgi:hypothetical protein
MIKEKKLNLYQKIVEIRRTVQYIKKDAEAYKFVYATESALLGRIREKMDELGVILETDMLDIKDVCFVEESQTKTSSASDGTASTVEQAREYKGPKAIEVNFEFTWVNAENPEERISKNMLLRSDKSDAQSIGSLMTYGHRYFLYKNLSVATDKDDPDAFEKKVAKKEYLSKEQQEYISKLVGDDASLRDRVLKAASQRQGAKVTQYSEIIEPMYDFIAKSILKIRQNEEKEASNG